MIMYKIIFSEGKYCINKGTIAFRQNESDPDYREFIKDVAEQGFDIVEGPTIHIPQYDELRRAEYPPIEDQLDKIYHSGVNAWKSQIRAIKEKYPKHMTEGSRIGEIPDWVREAVEEYLNNQ